jgi:hypothetical protein
MKLKLIYRTIWLICSFVSYWYFGTKIHGLTFYEIFPEKWFAATCAFISFCSLQTAVIKVGLIFLNGRLKLPTNDRNDETSVATSDAILTNDDKQKDNPLK